MADEKSDGKVHGQMPTEHAAIALWMVWVAHGEALVMLAERHGNDGWREELYERTQRRFDKVQSESSGDQKLLAHVDTSSDAFRSGSKMIDASFDRIKFL